MSGRIGAPVVLAFAGLAAACAPLPMQDPPLEVFDVVEATIPEMQRAMETGSITSRGLVDEYLLRLGVYDHEGPALNTMIRLNPNARTIADSLDRERRTSGPRGPLHGIPVVVKDNFDTRAMPTTAGSIALQGFVPPDDAHQVTRLHEAGAVILGKSNLHEMALGYSTISSLGGQTRNPYDPRRNPGGSSGGTGAAVAASFAAIGWGSDTCGSIRVPSAQNALFGLRPTKGLSSIAGIIPLSHTQDVAGPLARTVTDLAIGLDATIGSDPDDPATDALAGRALPTFREALDARALRGARLGVVSALFGRTYADAAVATTVRRAVDSLRAVGVEIVDVEVPELLRLLGESSVIRFEYKPDLEAYLLARPGAPVDSLPVILDRGLYLALLQPSYERLEAAGPGDSAAYRRAYAARGELAAALTAAMSAAEVDALVYPTILRQAALVEAEQFGFENCAVAAQSGLPALNVPVGYTPDGMPVGMEFLGRAWEDAKLVGLGFAYEQRFDPRRAPFSTPRIVQGAPAPSLIEARTETSGLTVVGRFSFDPLTSDLSFEVDATGATAELISVQLQRGAEGESGPALVRLIRPGQSNATGSVALTDADRARLFRDALYMAVYTHRAPTGAGRDQLRYPSSGGPPGTYRP